MFADYKISGTPSYCLIDTQHKVQSSGYPNFDSGPWRSAIDAWAAAEPTAADRILEGRG